MLCIKYKRLAHSFLYPLGCVMQNKCSSDLEIFHQNAMKGIHFEQSSKVGTCNCVFLTNELQITRYYLLHELRVTFYIRVTSYKLIFTYELGVTIYCSRYELNL